MALLPRSWTAAAAAAVCAALAVAAGAASPAMAQVAVSDALPPVVFLVSVMGLAMLADRSGLADRLAARLARLAGGSTLALFLWVCAACALLTAALSLDGAVVVMLPVLGALHRKHGAPLQPLLLATVGVANSFSAALPAGNPTNLVVMERLGLSPEGFIGRMLLPSLGATLACMAILWALERRALRGCYEPGVPEQGEAGGRERLALAALAAAAGADWVSPALGASPWLPVASIAAVALLLARQRPLLSLPLRTGVQIVSLLVVLAALTSGFGLDGLDANGSTLAGLAAVAGGVTAAAALANNLPTSAAVASLFGGGTAGSYAALLGLSAGALATPHGSVATLVSLDMAGCQSSRRLAAVLMTAALAAVASGTGLLWLTSSP